MAVSLRVSKDVYLLAGPPINDEGQAFLVEAECPLIVDSGAFGEMAMQNLFAYKRKLEEVEFLINTHAHVDRAGGDWLFERAGIKIAAGDPDALAIQSADPEYTASDIIGVEMKPAHVSWVIKDEALVCGAEILLLPGHTAGSLGVYWEGTLLAGDLLGPLSPKWGSDEKAWEESIRKAMEYEPEILCANNVCFKGKDKVRLVLEKSLEMGPPWL